MKNIPVPHQQTMSSVEIAHLVERRHDNVKRTIETLVERGVIASPQIEEKPTAGRPSTEYVFSGERGKRDSIVVVAQLCPEFTARLVDRWQELEAGAALPAAGAGSVPITQTARDFKALFGVARLLGMDKNASAISANQAVAKITGTNMLQLLGATHLESEVQALFYTPTELGKRLGLSARVVNTLLAGVGMQARYGDHWQPLPAAEGFCRVMGTGKRHGDGTMIQQVKWSDAVLPMLQQAA